MNGPVWVGWIMFILLAALSVGLWMGKGSILIAGYNTSHKDEKQKYNEKNLGRVMGAGFGVITVMTGIFLAYKFELPRSIHWFIPWGYLSTIAVVAILGNTVCKRK
ncbi:DUF3784 domain-containing protein [Gorillibacterium massiliense]|uniref:DUF3784 domain-containing protein n=1 Tax=Gorillibacterium massiliense TaxID=1280390 RepID=UPI0004B64DEA|nr:DUF3784 domain-containing protein [Gorillibacterium massiliense]